MHCEFEAAIQWQCAREVVGIITGGDFSASNIIDATQHTCCFGGCLAELARQAIDPADPDKPDDPFFSSSAPPQQTAALAAMSYDDLVARIDSQIPASDDLAQAIDWQKVWDNVLPYLLALLQKFLLEQKPSK